MIWPNAKPLTGQVQWATEEDVKQWNKVTLKWDFICGLNTSIRVDGRFDPKLHDPGVYKDGSQFHGLFEMEVVSLPEKEHDRRGEMKLNIRRQDSNLPPQGDALVSLLNAEFERQSGPGLKNFRYKPFVKGPATVSWTDTVFTISFFLANGEQFCDFAIELGRAVFAALGILDESGVYLARFDLRRDSFVMIDGSWIAYPRWLRMSHRLPIWGAEDRLI
jgi:hypothetical protein